MKTLLLVSACLLFATVSYSQSSKEKVMGVGIFKIDELTVSSLMRELGMNKMDSASVHDITTISNAHGAIELYLGSVKPRVSNSFARELNREVESDLTDGYRVIKLKTYKVKDLEFKDIKLTFYNDTLITFYSKNPIDIEKVLTYKYGDPEVYEQRDTISCIYKLTGIPEENEAFMIMLSWRAEQGQANSFVEKQYNDKCEPEYTSAFSMSDKAKEDNYQAAKRSYKERLKKSELEGY
jgi:hypothetical protein